MEEMKKKTILTPASLIDYAQGGIVSKELIHTNTGNITFFAIDEGQKISEHSAPFDATVMIVEGEAEIIIGGEPFILKAGEMIVMPANEPHALNAVKAFKMMLIMIRSLAK
ncbi:cupin domain-containing protein [Porphyromonas pogonae]|uniref:cupin domain-containing protein n=1 Tax=Porphyromonas pogonae TaxID=867595 RepID=UPI0038B52439